MSLVMPPSHGVGSFPGYLTPKRMGDTVTAPRSDDVAVSNSFRIFFSS